MHPNPAFRAQAEAEARALAAARGFGILTAAGPEGVLASHLPFLLDGDRAELHMVRSTLLCRHLREVGEVPALLVVSGPDGYISPDWYGEDDLVPTWNYVAVHLRGRLRLVETPLRGHLERVSARFEGTLPKKPWTMDKMQPATAERMMRSILPAEFVVESVESTVKLNQNRSDAARARAADRLAEGTTPGMETPRLAALMREVPPKGGA